MKTNCSHFAFLRQQDIRFQIPEGKQTNLTGPKVFEAPGGQQEASSLKPHILLQDVEVISKELT